MISLIIWCVYGIFVGSIAKAIVPGEETLVSLKPSLSVQDRISGGTISVRFL